MAENCTHNLTAMQLTRQGRGRSFVRRTATTANCRIIPGYITIDMLPDEILLGIFDFCIRIYMRELPTS